MMLSIARTVLRPAFSRSFVAPLSSIHTLPDLPYAYNVRSIWNTNIQLNEPFTRPSNRIFPKK